MTGNGSQNKNSQECWSCFCISVTKCLGKRQPKGRNIYLWLMVLETLHTDGCCCCFGPEVRQNIMTIRKTGLEVVAYLMAASKQQEKGTKNFKGIHYPPLNWLPTGP